MHLYPQAHPPPPTPYIQAPANGDGRDHNNPNGPDGHDSKCVEVAQGAARSLRAGTDEERIADFVHGADGFGDVGLPPPKVGIGSAVKAQYACSAGGRQGGPLADGTRGMAVVGRAARGGARRRQQSKHWADARTGTLGPRSGKLDLAGLRGKESLRE